MSALAPIRIVIAGVDRFSKTMSGVEKRVQKLSQGFTSVGSKLSVGLTAPLGAAAFASMKVAADFDLAMRKVQAKSDVVGVSLDQLREQAKQLGRDTQFSAVQAAGAMNELASAGWNTQQIFQGLPAILSLAASDDADLALAAQISANTMAAFNIQASESSRVADIFAATATASTVSLEDLGETMKYAAPVAKQFGATLEDAAAASAFLGNIGIKGSMAGTAMTEMFVQLSAGSKEAQSAMKYLGVDVADSSGKIRPMLDILTQLSGRFKSLTQKEQMQALSTIFGQRAMKAVGPMLADLGTAGSSMEQLSKGLKSLKPGRAKEMADIINSGAAGSFRRFTSALEGLGIAFAESGLLDMLTRMADGAANVFASIGSLPKPVLVTISAFAGFAAAVGPLLVVLGQMLPAITAVSGAVAGAGGVIALASNPVGWIIAGVLAAAAAFVIFRDQLQPVIDTMGGIALTVMGIFSQQWEAIAPGMAKLWETLKKIVTILAPFIALLQMIAWAPLLVFLKGLALLLVPVGWLLEKVAAGWGLVADGVLYAMGKIGEFFKFLDSSMGGPVGKLLRWFMGDSPAPAVDMPAQPAGSPAGAPLPGMAGVDFSKFGTPPANSMPAFAQPLVAADNGKKQQTVVVHFKNRAAGVEVRSDGDPSLGLMVNGGAILAGAM